MKRKKGNQENENVKVLKNFDVVVKKWIHFGDLEAEWLKEIKKEAERKVLKHKRNLKKMEIMNCYEWFLVEDSEGEQINKEFLSDKFRDWMAMGSEQRKMKMKEYDSLKSG